ncbi:hypothetical protein NKJ16_24840 [Mesorhizobium sp. M0179]|uniref:hypothetical protein n=1 Tax=unclassified Mesorhizobium TaxID=325217 RepID=UPI0012EB3A87|nr:MULTISPECIES: hypothetical protein [unclassified Mesorhizobium]WJI69571.1 hypothetical protein NLY36_01840 [Mesorhizobium sp. C399B]
MKAKRILLVAACASLLAIGKSYAGFTCGGPLTDSQVEGFKTFFDPDFNPSLTHTGGAIAPENMSKVLSAAALKKIEVAEPVVAASTKLDDAGAKNLQGWLNANAGESIPGWFSTTLGIVAPAAWMGLAADVAIQLINSSGDAGRIKLANIAGTVSKGGFVGVLHRVAKDAQGKRSYIWNYAYTAELNGQKITFLLAVCSADVVVK